MRIIPHSIALGVLVLATTASFADGGIAPVQQIEINASTQRPTTTQAVDLSPGFDTVFEMSTGRRMEVTATKAGIRVKYGRLPARVLYPDGHGAFVSSDGQLVLTFELDPFGQPEGVRLSLPAAMA